MALKITIAAPTPVVHVISSGTGWLTLLVTFLVGAATALTVQLVVQFLVVPRVETRKRREDRWERNVLELGELLTTVLDRRAYEAKVEQGKFRDLRQLESEPELDQRRIAQLKEEQGRTAQQATWAFGDLVRTRLDWLANRVRNFAPEASAIVKLDKAALHYRTRAIFVQVRPQDDERTESAFDEGWDKEYDARGALVKEVKQLADLPLPPRAPRRRQSVRTARKDGHDLLGGPDPM